MTPLVWVLTAAALGFGSSLLFSSALGFARGAFIGAHALVVLGYCRAFTWFHRISPATQLRRRWPAGVIGGVLIGAILAQSVLGQPASPAPAGSGLVRALVWEGVVYGVVDALLLSVVPVLAVYGLRPAGELRKPGGRWRWGVLALTASAGITAAYHLGFAEFRGPSVIQPVIGNVLITAGYLLTGNPLAPVVGHVIMHGAAVLHGSATTVQLPPHY